jgi:hypothetical protein
LTNYWSVELGVGTLGLVCIAKEKKKNSCCIPFDELLAEILQGAVQNSMHGPGKELMMGCAEVVSAK